MSTTTTKVTTQNIADSILDPVLTPSTAISINNVTVSFKTPKGTYTAVKEISLTVTHCTSVSLGLPYWFCRMTNMILPDQLYDLTQLSL